MAVGSSSLAGILSDCVSDCGPQHPGRAGRRVQSRLAPVAQLDRVLPSEGRGRTFESSRARHLFAVGQGSLQRLAGPQLPRVPVWALLDPAGLRARRPRLQLGDARTPVSFNVYRLESSPRPRHCGVFPLALSRSCPAAFGRFRVTRRAGFRDARHTARIRCVSSPTGRKGLKIPPDSPHGPRSRLASGSGAGRP